MDKELQDLLTSMVQAGRRPVSEGTPQQARDQIAARKQAPGRDVHRVYDDTASAGPVSVPVRVYVPDADPVGVTVYLHGGGWVIGSVDSFDNVARELAYHSGSRVISVDYSLAPESSYPAALNEAVAAIEWAAAQFPGEPIAVAGDSAGGNLATVAARKIHERATVQLAVQLLMYPVTDSDTTRGSYLEVPPVPTLLSKAEMEWFWNHYLPDTAARTAPDAAPLRAETLSELPPTVLVLARHDPLRDEGLAYARALEQHGVPVELTVFDGMCHGFIGLVGAVDQADQALREAGHGLRRQLTAAPLTRAGQQ